MTASYESASYSRKLVKGHSRDGFSRQKEPVTDLQEVLSMLSTLGGSEIWQLEWLIDRVEDREWGMSWL